ncbi:asparagine synthase (glutamine-hydrolyzing) [Texcoconibacillus texcoconensis]|uniref:asparagine synthase (glutamine-hydrolyzing) n=1 Tax=Texcoconibacillus texcoconensis TaxID=1095777 RepID=A0A840QNP1_9BACI|nr:asparagine synthase (glutamine-hydrolyzing) [Texcoconibacillus texcoconensis]MBB5173002.1 asparagine synthase (glutamine-hydrolyzing) [Texcoconibacillus texcoconensis]
MCGITGWIDYERDMTQEKKTVKSMAQTLNRRGPDALNVMAENDVCFGHTRLVVVDPAGGAQPMTKEHDSGTYTICYNGELYNTHELRDALKSLGYSFHSHSDTEVVLTAYIAWKEACVEKMNGIFAFAIWDHKERQLFLARDRLGVKPLFYKKTDRGILFASELKALLAHPEVEPVIKEEGLLEVIALSPSRTPGHGVFDGIDELRPAHWLRLNREGVKVQRYWQVSSREHTENETETAASLRNLLEDTVSRQLISDVPVASFLSGGVDSSALAAFTKRTFTKENRGELPTYSIDYTGNDAFFSSNHFQPDADAPYAEKVSKMLNTNHRRCLIDNSELANVLDEAVYARDLPGMADIDSSLLWFCKQMKQDVTVALSGECADEIFGGYPWFHQQAEDNEIFPWMRSLNERTQLLRGEWRERLNLRDYVSSRYLETIAEAPTLAGESDEDARRRQLFYVNMIWFMTTLLDRKDRMSMAASLEVRVPFADHRLVEYVWNIPWEMKNAGGREKGILRQALEGLLPEDVLYRKKSPYPKTHHPEYANAVVQRLEKIIEDHNAPIHDIFDHKKLKQLCETKGEAFKKPFFGQLMTDAQLIAHLIQVNTWLDHYNVKIDIRS